MKHGFFTAEMKATTASNTASASCGQTGENTGFIAIITGALILTASVLLFAIRSLPVVHIVSLVWLVLIVLVILVITLSVISGLARDKRIQ